MATPRIDGSSAANSLLERISIEDNVGSNLAPRTRNEYARKINYISDYISASGLGTLTPDKLFEYISTKFQKQEVAQATGRSLKAVALYWIAEEAQAKLGQGSSLVEYEKAYDSIQQLSTRSLPKQTAETSSQKLRQFPKEMLQDLIADSQQSARSKHSSNLVAFLEANMLVGLRPNEWFDVDFFYYLHRDNHDSTKYLIDNNGRIKSTVALTIGNSKTTHGRSNGERREILLTNISDKDLAKLMLMREIAQSFKSKFDSITSTEEISSQLFKPLQQTLQKTLIRLGYSRKKLPTLYSTRHQAVANAKQTGMTERELAAMFGHSSTRTAKRHYGKKTNGWAKIEFRPSAESVACVLDNAKSLENIVRQDRVLAEAREWQKAQSIGKQSTESSQSAAKI